MSSIFKIKPWLTVEDTARYINLKAEQDVKNSDIYDLAIDSKLKAYVRFRDDIQCYLEGFNAYTLKPKDTKRDQKKFTLPPNCYQLKITSRTIGHLTAKARNEYTPLLRGSDLESLMNGFHNLSPFDWLECEVDCHNEPDIVFKTQDVESLIKELIPTSESLIPSANTPSNPSKKVSQSNSKSDELGKKREKSLLMTIGALAKLAAHLGGNTLGTFENPTAKGLRNKLEEKGELLPHGLGKSSWIQNINDGVKAYDKERDEAQKENKNSN